MLSTKRLSLKPNKLVDQRFQEMAAGRRKHYCGLPAEMLNENLGMQKSSPSSCDKDSCLIVEPDGVSDKVSSNGDAERTVSISDYEDDVFFLKAFDDSEVEKTCIVALSTVNNIQVTTGDNIKSQMRDYLQQVFDLPKDRLLALTQKAATAESPMLCLSVTVLHANSLTAKDANGSSDPYCRLGIISQADLDSSRVKDGLEDWQEDGFVDNVVNTTIKQATLEPEWKEELELSVTNPKNEVLVLEVWDSDAEEVQNTSHIKGLRGFGQFLSDLRKGVDDFMGRCFYPLQSIPANGETKSFVLQSHTGKTKHGYITLTSYIRGIKKNTPVEVSVWEHTMLTRALVNRCSRQGNMYQRRWDGELLPDSELLLEQHAILNGLNKLQPIAIRFSVLLKYHKIYAVTMEIMHSLLLRIKALESLLPKDFSLADLQQDREDRSMEWLVQLFHDLNALRSDVEDILRKHLSIYNIAKSNHLKRLEDTMHVLKELYTFRPFVFQLTSDKVTLKEILEQSVQEATPTWFINLNAKLLPRTKTPANVLGSIKNLAENCLQFSRKVLKSLDPLFMEMGISYFCLFYVAMDNLLGKEAKSRMKMIEASDETAQGTFELHMICRDIYKLSQYITPDLKTKLTLSSSHLWFKHHVKSWISLAVDRCKLRIQKSIELNETVTAKIKISTSAIDSVGFIIQVGNFWKDLDWPDASVAYGLMVYMVQEMSDLAHFYVEQLYKAHTHLYDEHGKFMTSEELSVDLNSMHHIRALINNLPQELNFEPFYKWLEEKTKLGVSARDIVDRLLHSVDEDFANKMKSIIKDFSEKMAPDICKCVEKMLSAPDNVSDLDAVGPLLDYLTINLQTLGDSTFLDVFNCILQPIWSVCLRVMRGSLAQVGKTKGQDISLAYQRLHQLLNALTSFFNVGGKGLDIAVMQDETFLDIKSELDFLKLNSDELTLQFFSDLVGMEEKLVLKGEKVLGEVLVSVRYDTDKRGVDVNVVQALGLPVMDKIGGSSDPYSTLVLLPQRKFVESSKKTFRTPVIKATLDPYFDKDFLLPASADHSSSKGSILLLNFFDHDIITANDFIGMCVVPLHSLPGLPSPSTDQKAPTRRNLTLPLFELSEDKYSRAALELASRSRKGDHRAISFFKENKKIFGKYFKKLFQD